MEKENYIIEKATYSDLDEISKLYYDVSERLEETINYPAWFRDSYPTKVFAERALKVDGLFALKINNKIIGTFILNRSHHEAYDTVIWNSESDYSKIFTLHTFAVHHDYAKKGLAKKMLSFIENYAREQAATSIRLDVCVNNRPAMKLYEDAGYRYTGTVELNLDYSDLILFRLYELVL